MLHLGWVAAAHDVQSHPTKKLVYLNVDETMIAYGYKKQKGTVATGEFWEEVNENLLYDAVSTGQTHTNMSWIGVIASDPEVQKELPQVFRASKKKFPLYLKDYADQILPDNVEIWLAESMWMTQAGFLLWLHHLYTRLEGFIETHCFVLVADASKTHINEDIAAWCLLYGFVLVLIPGGLTWLLQPLDVYVFAGVKQRLKSRLLELRLEDEHGQVSKQAWLGAVVDRARSLEDLDHAHYFELLGTDGLQNNLRLVENEVISQEAVAGNPRRHPTEQELAEMLGRRNVPFYRDLMQKFLPPDQVASGDSQASQQRSQVRIVLSSSQAASSIP